MSDYDRRYREYFRIDENYFPCIDDTAIEAGAAWDDTYPHETFVDLLKKIELMLTGTTKRSVWINGAYGTGKSKCAYTLRKILEVPDEELIHYWNSFDNLKQNQDLLEKIRGHRQRGILTVYRYASGDISSPRDLFFKIQESIKIALNEKNIPYKGEESLKEGVISWLEDESHKTFINALLKKPKWNSAFTQSSADEILNALKGKKDAKELMNNLFALADEERISAMTLDADILKSWIQDICRENHLKIVMVWDEFSDYFKQNRDSLSEFQKIVALCQDSIFYLVIVTHQTESIMNREDETWKIVKQRFDFSSISLPDSIAFDLIGHAFQPIETAENIWKTVADDLNSRVVTARNEVMEVTHILKQKQDVMTKILPIHPMAALVLKNIASAFQSNQRSMFDFIKKNKSEDVKAFQWFISNSGPSDDHPLLTIDYLWNFFYENGREDLSSDIRRILDVYPQYQGNLRGDEQSVLKTILIMLAIDRRLRGAIKLLKPSSQTIDLAFQGIPSLENAAKNIAIGLKNKGVLIEVPIGNNKFSYDVAIENGGQKEIEEHQTRVRKISSTDTLVSEGTLSSVLSLPPALRLRYNVNSNGELISATEKDFSRKINQIKNETSNWHLNAVLAFAKWNDNISSFRKLIIETAKKEEYKNTIFIDALSTPLSEENFNHYVEFSAMGLYYREKNTHAMQDNNTKAKFVLSTEWKNEISRGKFIIYHYDCPEGKIVQGQSEVVRVLESILGEKYQYLFDTSRGVTENQLKLTNAKQSAKSAIEGKTSGVMTGAENSVLKSVWAVERYWENPSTESENISVIKRSLLQLIETKFKKDGQISFAEIYEFLEEKYNFAPCNLYAFIIGFLLREFGNEPYRYNDDRGAQEPMTPDKLAEMIKNYISDKESKSTYIVKITPEERAFNEVTEIAWGLDSSSYSSAIQVAGLVRRKMEKLGLPVWSLKKVDTKDVYEIIEKYVDLVRKEGSVAHNIAIEIGRIALDKKNLGNELANLITPENCNEGMIQYLNTFEDGELLTLAKKIGATNEDIIRDLKNYYSVEYSHLWNIDTENEQIKQLIVDYKFVNLSNDILGCHSHSKSESFETWNKKLNFVYCTCDALKNRYPILKKIFEFLSKLSSKADILPNDIKDVTEELIAHGGVLKEYFDNEQEPFSEIYKNYLDDLSSEEIQRLVAKLEKMFSQSESKGNKTVKELADECRKNRIKTQMMEFWKGKTSSENPIDWSNKHKTPILSIINPDEYDLASKSFETLNNRNNATELEIRDAYKFLQDASFYSQLNDEKYIDDAFCKKLLSPYATILSNLDEIREKLYRVNTNVYGWLSHPTIQQKIKEYAEAEYNAGGSDLVISEIDKMSNDELKHYLIDQIKNNMDLGIAILKSKGGE